MNINPFIIIIISIICFSCSEKKDHSQEAIQEILKTEAEFASYAESHGVAEAFMKYAADNAVLLRRNRIIAGKDSISHFLTSQNFTDIKLSWKADFADASSSGDMAYTYGKYVFSAKDPEGKEISDRGIFHTVWKRQSDGSWKFVWD
ncbi:MAG: nuclear transport factor 2 family protein [Bacteroidetes bacterium]|nr:MAG: nuclear transport factor 2 family protein [Bacteroidota bacterium]REK05726.1 MAG: nuclear transport factor 2 family protein [Bacteroidota bacterium]REK31968.1 MAG: nuclear transport factor 2 family protein [Bacteroidota bacterium]REK50033.1 MAG: nuclear transport factor 2 family protein [Bacteroidota bacterium]